MRTACMVIVLSGMMSVVPAAAGGDGAAVIREPPREFVRVIDRAYQRIGLTVTITDERGRPLRGLTRDLFRVYEDGEPVEIADFGGEGERRDRPLSVAVLLDLSQSMGSQVKRVREAAAALLRQLRPQDEIMVAKFNDQITILQPFTGDPSDPDRTLKSLGRARGGTALFRSIEETLKDLRERPGRKIILAVSDGDDSVIEHDGHYLHSLYLQDLRRLCMRTETTVYGVRPGMSVPSWNLFEGFVAETGGRLLYSGGDLESLFASLGEEFMSQYYIAYDIDPKLKEGRRRRIRIEVDHPHAIVRTMRGYATPASLLDTLLGDLDDRDEGLRADAAYELGFIGDRRAVDGLMAALRDRDREVRRVAADALARQAATAAIPRLVECLADDDEAVRVAAAVALTRIGADSLPRLLNLVRREGDGRRARPRLLLAAQVVGRVGDERAIEPLGVMLAEGSVAARQAAASALGELGLSAAIAPLRQALADDAVTVRETALGSIVRIAGAAAEAVIEDHLSREPDPGLRQRGRELLESM
jgi:VWFA-related protein